MAFPENLYYQLKEGHRSYTRQPTDSFDVSRFLKSQPAFEILSRRERKQKKLILSDWTAFNWSSQKIRAVQAVLERLIAQGFTIYISKPPDLEPLLKTDLASLNNKKLRQAMKPSHPNDILATAAIEHHLSADAIHILDDYWIEVLLNEGNKPVERCIRLSDYKALPSQNLETLKKVLKEAKEPLAKLIFDEFSEKADEKAEEFMRDFEGIAVKNQFQIVYLFNSDFSDREIDMVLKKDYTLKYLMLNGKIIKRIEELSLSFPTTIEGVIKLLNKTAKLKKLTLAVLKLEKLFHYKIPALEFLEELVLIESPISSDILQKLLAEVPNLKKIHLMHVGKLIESMIIKKNSLPCLEEIQFSGISITAENISSLLTATPQLQKIGLDACWNTIDTICIEKESLPCLEEILLKKSDIHSASLSNLLAAAPQVKKIDLNNCSNLTEEIKIDRNLYCLEEINLSWSAVSTRSLANLLARAPNLKKIELYSFKDTHEEMKFETNLFSLKEIDLSGISPRNIANLLAKAPNLKKISLAFCENIQEEIKIESELLCLEEIKLTSTNISLKSLGNLLAKTPSLKKISLRNCRNILDSSNGIVNTLCIEKESFRCLEKIRLYKSSIQSASLSNLLAAAPQVKKIDLNNCSCITEEIKIDGNLNCLEEINLSWSAVSTRSVANFLVKAPNLKIIDLRHCSGLPNSYIKKLQTAYPDVYFVEDKTHSSGKDSHRKPDSALTFAQIDKNQDTRNNNPISDPEHKASEHKHFKPNETPFVFKGKNKTKNQGMIIEKFCQYLTQINKNLHLIPRLQDGICNAVTHLFIETEERNWNDFIKNLANWNGEKSSLQLALKKQFNILSKFIADYQFKDSSRNEYLGDNLESFVKTLSTACVLKNPWHAIAIKKTTDASWLVYDPNYIDGVKKVAENELMQTIHTAVGDLISVNPGKEIIKPKVNNLDTFFKNGGFLVLNQCHNLTEILKKIPQNYLFSKEALEGLLLRNVQGIPAWVLGLKNVETEALTQQALNQFILHYPHDFKEQLQRSMSAMATFARAACIEKLSNSPKPQIEDRQGKDNDKEEKPNLAAAVLIKLIRETSYENHLENCFKTWTNQKTEPLSLLQYIQRCFQPAMVKNRLIQFESDTSLIGMRFALERYAQQNKRRIFYIHSPDDLVCLAPFIQRQGDKGFYKKRAGRTLI